MAYPPAYDRTYSFTDWETLHPADPKPGPQLDAEYDAVSNALTATQDNLALIQRADGALANDSVGEDQLQDGIFDGIADGITADAEAAAAAAAASAAAAAGSAASASASASAASTSAATASGAAAQAGVSQGIAQTAANDAALARDNADDAAVEATNAANEAEGFRNEASLHEATAFNWAELLTGPVMPAPPGWPEAVDDGMFSSKWWAIRAREYNSVETIDLGTAGADIGEAFDIWDAIPGNDLGPGLTYATWGSPVQTYVLTDRSNPSDPASWTNITGGPGPPGPGNTLTIGTVTTGAVGSPAAASITGASPNQVLNLTLPTGATGATGGVGPAGPPNALSIGTVTTVPDGTPSSANITGTAPTQVLNLTLTAGPQGIQGPIGPVGPSGTPSFANPAAQIGLAVVNGVATSAMRSDAAPALSQAIAPVWTGVHNWGTSGAMQSNATMGARGRTNAFEWGHINPAGYGNTLGFSSSGGRGFLAFNAEHGTITNSFRTRGIIGRIIMSDVSGGLIIGRAALANADDQGLTTDVTVAADGTTTFQGRVNTVGEFHAAALITYLEHAGGPVLKYVDTDAATDDKNWRTRNNNGAYIVSSENDAGTENGQALNFVKVAGVITTMSFGNVTHNPAFNFLGTGAASFGGSITGRPVVFAIDSAVNTKIQSINSTSSGMVGTQSAHPLEIRTSNTIRATFSADGSSLSMAPRILGPAGTVAAPAYSFTSDPSSGMYSRTPTVLTLVANGVSMIDMHSSRINLGAVLYGVDGTVAAPSYTFTSDTNTGMYLAAADVIDFATGGVIALRLATTGVYPFAPIYNVPGTLAAPGYSFDGDSNSGLWREGPDALTMVAGGVAIAKFWGPNQTSQHRMFVPVGLALDNGTAALPALYFETDYDTGLYRAGVNDMRLVSGGVARLIVTDTGNYARVTVGLADGSASAPGLSFENDPNTGFYRFGSDSFVAVAGNVAVASFNYPGGHPQLGVGMGSQGIPSLTFDVDRDTGMYLGGTDQIGFTTAGVQRMTIDAASGVSAAAFVSTSSRTIKRETGAPAKPASILARLRPIMYRLLAGGDHEQLGLIAEEVHEVCPQLSDGKTVAYDRLAILLLAAWQDEHATA